MEAVTHGLKQIIVLLDYLRHFLGKRVALVLRGGQFVSERITVFWDEVIVGTVYSIVTQPEGLVMRDAKRQIRYEMVEYPGPGSTSPPTQSNLRRSVIAYTPSESLGEIFIMVSEIRRFSYVKKMK